MTPSEIDPDAFRAFELAGWAAIGDTYGQLSGALTSPSASSLLDAAQIGPGQRVLDVCTGPGYAAGLAAERGASVTAVDISKAMLVFARRLYPKVDFREADAENLPFPEDAFDAVVCAFGLGHFGRPEVAVAGFARVTRPGGHVATSWWDQPERNRCLGLFMDAVKEAGATPPPDLPTGPPLFRFSVDAEVTALLRGAGLHRIEIRPVTYSHRVSGLDEVWEGMLGGTVRTKALIVTQPESVQRRIREALARLLRPHAVTGGFELPVAVKIASGVCRSKTPSPFPA
jgi:SAM-dependent methyltransferase